MSVLRRAFARPERRTADLAASLLALRGQPTFAGPYVNDDQALRLEAVWACVQLKADQLSTLPLDAYRKTPEGTRLAVSPTPPLVASPSLLVDRQAWLYQLSVSLDLRGNAYGLVFARDARGYPTQIELFHPDFVSVMLRGQPGVPSYAFVGHEVDTADVFHVAENLIPGYPVGLGPIEYARQTIGLGPAAEEFGARFFGDGGHPTGVLETDGPISQEQSETIKARWRESTTGSRAVAVLGLGVSYKPVQITPEDSQFLETQKLTTNRIAARFHVPPEFIGGETGDTMTYKNVESRYVNLLSVGLAPRMARIEHALDRLLPKPIYTKFDEAAFFRMDTRSTHEVIAADIAAGILTVNEARQRFDLPPLPPSEIHPPIPPPKIPPDDSPK